MRMLLVGVLAGEVVESFAEELHSDGEEEVL
jgi:hypothetical protein